MLKVVDVYEIVSSNNEVIGTGNALDIMETLYPIIESILGYFPLLQEFEDDGELEIYLHTDSYEDLSKEQIERLNKLGITECNSLNAICSLCDISIRGVA